MDTGLDHQVPTPEVNENYVNCSVMLPRGYTYSRWKVIGWKRYASGNGVVSINNNSILFTRKYCAEFDDGEVRKTTADVIAEYMHASCD